LGILLDKGADVNAAEGQYGTPLQVAAEGGNTELVSILLDKGADVNAAGGECKLSTSCKKNFSSSRNFSFWLGLYTTTPISICLNFRKS
jgi:ankyrin repeat protein